MYCGLRGGGATFNVPAGGISIRGNNVPAGSTSNVSGITRTCLIGLKYIPQKNQAFQYDDSYDFNSFGESGYVQRAGWIITTPPGY